MATQNSQQKGVRVFQDENVTDGVTASNFLSGVNNVDNGALIEKNFLLPYMLNPAVTWLDYRCALSIELDPGIVLHEILPQAPQPIDTLASGTFDPQEQVLIEGQLAQVNFNRSQPFEKNVNQANTVGAGKYTDGVQRMATSEYRFRLRGWAVRAGYKIPIPGLKLVCGVPAIPDKQVVLSDSEVIANYSGVPIFFSQWDLWYFIAVPPKTAQLPPPNLAEHIRADAKLPPGMQVPISAPDSLSVKSGGTAPKKVIVPKQGR
jgi:hypothetical protein